MLVKQEQSQIKARGQVVRLIMNHLRRLQVLVITLGRTHH